MTTEIRHTPAETAYIEALAAGPRSAGDAWFGAERAAARAQIADGGLPHRRMEAWRWTDLRSLIDDRFPPSEPAGAQQDITSDDVFKSVERWVVAFVDGAYRKDLSDLPDGSGGIELHSLEDVLDAPPGWLRDGLGQAYAQEGEPIVALNTAFVTQGLALRIGAGETPAKPIELRFFNSGSQPQTSLTRFAVVLEEGAALTLLESHTGAADRRYVANTVTEIHVHRNARLQHVRLQDESMAAVHLSNVHVTIEGEADYRGFTLSAGARVARNQVFACLAGEGGNVDVSGAYLLGGRQHCDTALLIDHAVAECTSDELFKCVMDDDARGIFQGKIIVRPDAQKTEGMQMSQGLLLSERAEFDSKPELEIFADDVRCTHGATSGDLDEDMMFYLRSRGIPENEAKGLLIAAFVGEAIEKVSNAGVREILNAYAVNRLNS